MKFGEIMMKEICDIPQMLQAQSDYFQQLTQRKANVFIQKYNSVVILARGTSDNAAHFLKFLIETKIGLPCGLASPSAVTLYSAKLIYKNTLIIAISQSGESLDLISFAKSAKDGGGFLLAITNNENSPLALLSDQHIPIMAGPEDAIPATKSYIGELMASHLLVSDWKGEIPVTSDLIQKSQDAVFDDSYLSFADEIDISHPLYVLGRGYSYPNAKEFALKLQETCHIPVQGSSSSDFMHGPIASLNSKSQVIFMSPGGIPGNAFGEAPNRIRSIVEQIFWIGNGANPIHDDILLNTPCMDNEIDSSICDAIIFQKITHRLALSNHLNPDLPKGLNKITRTF